MLCLTITLNAVTNQSQKMLQSMQRSSEAPTANSLSKVIIDAIRHIIESTDKEVSYNVDSDIFKNPWNKHASKKTVIHITITEQVT